MSDITNPQKETRYADLQKRVASTFTRHNDVSYSLFNVISKFSEILPGSLNNLVGLSDMITDAVVVSGRSSLSKSVFQLPIIKNTLNINKDSSSLTLSYRTAREYSINVKKSYIQSSNKFSIFNKTKSSLSSFEDLLRGSPILIETPDQYFKYTLALTLESKVSVSCIDLELGLTTSSYPLISEVYYINDNNKKIYCTILNSSDTKLDLDADRQKDNKYSILLPNIKTNRLYITLEDKGKTSLLINNLSVKRLEYAPEGELIVGPIKSSSPILKAAVDVAGDTSSANFYISPDNETWYELAAPSDVPFGKDLSKIISFNTVSDNSLKSDKDFKEFYLRIYLKRKLNEEAIDYTQVHKQDLNGSGIDTIPLQAENAVVYKYTKPLHYGSDTYKNVETGVNISTPYFSYLESQGTTYVRGFVETHNTLLDSGQITDCNIKTKALRVGADDIDSSKVDPLTSNIYGYTVSVKDERINTKTSQDIVFSLKDIYPKDVYTITQDDREIKIDLSLGYISDSTEVLLYVDSEKPIQLLDSTAKVIKILTPREFKETFYISLIEEGMFEVPEAEGLEFNALYPIKLNTENAFALRDNQIVTKEHLIEFKNISRLKTEIIDAEILLSKENGCKIVVIDELLKNRYTEYSEESISAYGETTVIKLKNKFIKKGSLVLSVLEND